MKTEDLYPHGALQQKLLQSKRTLLYTDKPPNLIAHQNFPGPLAGEVTDGECTMVSTSHDLCTIRLLPIIAILCFMVLGIL